ncbi:MAG TPA: DUF2177 family protein [Patescibacteria group bacterium]|nr:DUF2177 family protein [Patescibacteria group bacterium]
MNFLKSYLISLVVLFPIDLVWLTLTKKIYDNWLSPFERTLNIPAAILVYLFIPFGLVYLVISKNIGSYPNFKILIDAFVYGVCSYSVYDLTNLATLKNWSIQMVIVDIIWGGVLCIMVTFISLLILNKWS